MVGPFKDYNSDDYWGLVIKDIVLESVDRDLPE